MYDYDKLNGRIKEKFKKQYKFAEAMGWSERTTSLKMNQKVPFNQKDINKAIEILDLTINEVQEYFFKIKVQEN